MSGRGSSGITLHKDDVFFFSVWIPEMVFVLLFSKNIITMFGGYVLIAVCLLNAYSCLRRWYVFGRYS